MVKIVVKKPETGAGGGGQPAPAAVLRARAITKPYGKIKEKLRSAEMDVLFASLTPKQRAFVTALTQSGVSKREAYMRAYRSKGGNLETKSKDAWHVAQKPNVARVLNAVQQREWTGAITDADDIRRTVLRTLRDVALNGDRDNNRVAAAVALGKVSTVALFSERREVIHRNEGALDVQLELAARLQAMLGPAQVVDTVAVSDQSQMPQQGTIDAEAPATLLETPEPDPQA